MIRRSFEAKLILIIAILLLCMGRFAVFGEDRDENSEIRYFTRDFIVELIHAREDEEYTRDYLEGLSRQLSLFFINFKYDTLREPLLSLLSDDDKYGLAEDFLMATEWLDQNKESLFSMITINPEQFYVFSSKETCSFTTLTMDTSNLDLSSRDMDLMLMVFSLGITAGGPYYLENDEYQVRGISPNLMMASQIMSGMITGGPGGLPIKPGSSIIEDDYAMDASPIAAMISKIPDPEIRLSVREIPPVFILDTIPQITDIYEGYVAYEEKNEIIKDIFSLFGTHHSIQFHNGSDPDFDTYLNENYGNSNLSDHGIFIAGIIHLLSPNTPLHLIEVMNQYGAGTLDSLLWGFHEVLGRVGEGQPFVVNSSLTTKLRFPGKVMDYNEEITDNIVKIVYGIQKPELFLLLLNEVTQLINERNGIVIAAAGNDSEEKDHYAAGYPARFEHVLGVGSTRRDGTISSFSNEPGTDGLMAFGGEVDAASLTLDGILSIYISNPYSDSTTVNSYGFARWAGSSFATGMVSGTVALLLSRGYNLVDTLSIIRSSCYSSGGYDVLPVKQGP